MGEEKNSLEETQDSKKLVKVKGGANAHLYKRGEVYWIRASKSGKPRLQKSLDTKTLTTARLRRDDELAVYMGEKRLSNAHTLLVDDKFPEFLDLKKTKAPATYASIKNQWENHLKDYFSPMTLDEVTESSWLRYVARKRIESPDRKFFNDRKYLSMFLHWLHREGHIQKIPKLPNVDPKIKEGKVFTSEQIKNLLARAPIDLNLQIRMAVTMGMRIGEIMSLEWDQVDFKKKTIYLPAEKTKIRKERTFGISDACFADLESRFKNSPGSAVFASPHNPDKCQGRQGNKGMWASCKRLAKVPKEYRFHWLRHT
ncbi:MAG: tyrosine-type recombinase/integrase, partial [Pseudobdellovibrionaceae bacterium]